MAEGLLKFDLTEPAQVIEFRRATKALDLALVLWEIDQYLRDQIKYFPDSGLLTDLDVLEKVREKVHSLMLANNVSLDELLE